jgi:hypothetical protein
VLTGKPGYHCRKNRRSGQKKKENEKGRKENEKGRKENLFS